MINVYIYIENESDAKHLAVELLEAQLVAHASIDMDNYSYIRVNDSIKEQVNFVITAQTKALLFNEIVAFVEKGRKERIKIYSLPITQCNDNFSELIRENTKKI